ncbi:hypothetical protein chiPu_0013658 [Chiloscyllium punctatum]|uniref:Uncharacterized protein n=1 Tax=Chiloscyllium punctatum TaxID=137246 RepID=A0A401SXY4_CHIPU|nr:hypothetical protein [Chiloscyllium punctatum]
MERRVAHKIRKTNVPRHIIRAQCPLPARLEELLGSGARPLLARAARRPRELVVVEEEEEEAAGAVMAVAGCYGAGTESAE